MNYNNNSYPVLVDNNNEYEIPSPTRITKPVARALDDGIYTAVVNDVELVVPKGVSKFRIEYRIIDQSNSIVSQYVKYDMYFQSALVNLLRTIGLTEDQMYNFDMKHLIGHKVEIEVTKSQDKTTGYIWTNVRLIRVLDLE